MIMKNLLALFLVVVCSNLAHAQSQPPHPELLKEGRVHWVDNQLVVRFADQMNVQFGRNNRLGISNVDALLEQYNLYPRANSSPFKSKFPEAQVDLPLTRGNMFNTLSSRIFMYSHLIRSFRAPQFSN